MIESLFSHKIKTFSLNRGIGFSGKHAFGFLNISQFLSALNDNLFKFLTIYLLIDLQGPSHSNDILFWIGVFYVLPFLMFSSIAGVLADRFSKQKLIVLLKILEIIIIGGAFFAYAAKSIPFCYFSVFMLSLQSALMGPSKYSIIPEIVRRDQIARANGYITSFTYLAIIIGTFFASFLTQITGKNFLFALVICMIAAVCGFVTSLYIPHTPAKMHRQKISPWVLSQVYTTLTHCRATPRLIIAVLGSAFFLFLGAYLQLNIIPFAMECLNLSEVGGGYLFLLIAIGIALGATLAGKACRKEVDLGLSTVALIMIGVCLFLLPKFAGSLPLALICLAAFGIFGGLYIVPLESYIQSFSPSEIRGQVVATANFLSFFGILLAPLCLALFGKVFNISSATGFTLVGGLTMCAALFLAKYLSAPFLHFVSKKVVHPFVDLHYLTYLFGMQYQEDKLAILCEPKAWQELLLLFGESSKVHVFIVRSKKHFSDRILNYFSCFDVIYLEQGGRINPIEIHKKMDGRLATVKPVYFFTSKVAYDHFHRAGYFVHLMSEMNYQVKQVRILNTSHFRPNIKRPLKWVQMTIHFVDYKLPTPVEKDPELALIFPSQP